LVFDSVTPKYFLNNKSIYPLVLSKDKGIDIYLIKFNLI
jgi:hypothetical protein